MSSKLIFPIVFLLVSAASGYSQSLSNQVVASSGNYSSSASGSLSQTSGEAVVATLQDGQSMLTQGFQQPFTITVGVQTVEQVGSVQVYPNPVTDQLNIDLSEEWAGSTIQLFGAAAKLVFTSKSNTGLCKLQFTGLAAGLYELQIIDKSRTNRFTSTINHLQ
ncbi:MAG: T9SS type A sorting domain-containing protein [Flavobacteriales bacterium]|nr:T9SS type A sorting domain-containing protein [Flavobacteriales bacterium]